MCKIGTEEHIKKFLSLVPEGIDLGVAHSAYLYMLECELNREFIDKLLPLLTTSQENELEEYYKWNIQEDGDK